MQSHAAVVGGKVWVEMAAQAKSRDGSPADPDGAPALPVTQPGSSRADFEALYRSCADELGRFVVRALAGDRAHAEDVVQEVFARAWQHAERVASARDPRAFLFGIARNVLLEDERSRRRRSARELAAFLRRDNQGPDERHELIAMHDLVIRLFDHDSWLLLVARYVQELQADELAIAFQTTPAAIRKRLSRLTSDLATHLKAADRGVNREP